MKSDSRLEIRIPSVIKSEAMQEAKKIDSSLAEVVISLLTRWIRKTKGKE